MSDDLRALDVLRTLVERTVVGGRLVARVGGRGWLPPRFAKGRRLFARCGLPDPWDPSVVSTPVELGDVGLAARKVVAPHATAPEPRTSAAVVPPWAGQRSTASATPAVKAPYIPTRTPPRPPPPPPKPPAPIFGSAPRPALGKLPVRPDLDPSRAPTAAGAAGRPPPAAAGQPARPPDGSLRAAAPPEPRSGPRFSARPRQGLGTDGPREVTVPSPEGPPEPAVSPATPPPPVPTSRAPAASLDDLFGMGEGTRVRLAPTATADDGRRARVTDASQVKGAVDRRPPMLKKD